MEARNAVLIKKAKSRSFVHGAAILGICGFISKLLGAVFRIPLTNIVGAQGMGLYQMVFPLYTLLLTVSSSGLPSAISRLIAEKLVKGERDRARKIFTAALLSLIVLGVLAMAAVLVLYRIIAKVQGNTDAAISYIAIAPSLLFVAVISAFRGYFQGRQDMTPSAMSQLVEQGIKMAVGLALAFFLMPYGVEYAVLGAIAGVSVSELVAMVLLIIQYFTDKGRLKVCFDKKDFTRDLKTIYAISVPITLGGIILPLTQLIDSVLVINILSQSGVTTTATSLYGLMSGPVHSLINMPVILSLSLSIAIIPSLSASKAKDDAASASKKISLALKLTMITALPCFIGFLVLARPIIDLLYGGGLKVGEIDEPMVATALLMISSVSVVLIAFIQVITSVLQAMGRQLLPVKNLAIGAAVKVVLNLVLLPAIGIYGAAAATVMCFLTALFLNVLSLRKVVKIKFNIDKFFARPAIASGIMGILAYLIYKTCELFINPKIATLMAVTLGGVIYFALIMVLDVFDSAETKSIPLLNKLGKFAG